MSSGHIWLRLVKSWRSPRMEMSCPPRAACSSATLPAVSHLLPDFGFKEIPHFPQQAQRVLAGLQTRRGTPYPSICISILLFLLWWTRRSEYQWAWQQPWMSFSKTLVAPSSTELFFPASSHYLFKVSRTAVKQPCSIIYNTRKWNPLKAQTAVLERPQACLSQSFILASWCGNKLWVF